MTFAPQQLDTSSPTPIPLSSAVPDGTNTPIPVAGGPSYSSGGNTLTTAQVYIKDGNNQVEGLTTDANTVNSIMGRLTKIRDLLAATINVAVTNVTALGQALMASSSPVVIASDQSSIPVKGNFVEIAGAGTGVVTGTSTDFIASTDVSAYKWLSLHITGTATLTLTFQGSNDNVNFASIVVSRSDTAAALNTGSTAALAGASNVMYTGAVTYRYLRVRCTTFTSNASMAGNLELYTQTPAYALAVGQVAQSGTWTVSTQAADLTPVAAAAYTTTQTQADQSNPSARGVRVVLNMTAVGTGSVTLEIDAKDVASGVYLPLLTGAAVTTNSTNVYIVHPDLTAAANSIAKDILPRTWRVKVVANNANSATYSVGASYLI
jgi:hypothetical protein